MISLGFLTSIASHVFQSAYRLAYKNAPSVAGRTGTSYIQISPPLVALGPYRISARFELFPH